MTSPSADNNAYNDTPLAKQYRTLTGHNLVDFTPGNRYIGTSTGQAGVAVGVSAKAADLATALGTKSHATGDYSAALGVGANATLANAVALGAGSTTKTNATDITSATIGSITYGGPAKPFAGSGNVVAGDQVSVGAAGFERQIKHVAPGEINAGSTDAINGSQLYHVASGLQTQIANISPSGKGVHFYHVNGEASDNNYNNNGATGAKAMAAGINAQAKGASSIAIGNATVETESTANGAGTAKTASEGAIAIGDTSYAAGRHAVALGQARAEQGDTIALGSNARATAEYTTAIGNNAVSSKQYSISIGSSANTAAENSIAIGRDSSATANGSVALGYGSQATRNAINATDVKATPTATVANNQVYALEAASTTDKNNIQATVKGSSGALSVGTQQDTRQIINVAAGTEDSDAVNVAQLKSVANLVKNNTPTQVAAANGSKITVTNKGTPTAPNYELDLNADAKSSLNKADTAMQKFKVATVAAKGGTASAGEEVGNGETLTFKAGDNVSIAQQGKEITINATGTGASKVEAVSGSPISVAGTGTAADPYKVGVNTGALSNTATGAVNLPATNDAGKLVTANEIAKAINNSGFVVTSGKTGSGQVTGSTDEVVNPGEKVKFTAGDGIKIAQNNGEFVISNTGTGSGTMPTFADGRGTVANVSTTGGVTTVKFDTPLSYTDAAGALSNTPSNTVNLVGANTSNPVTLGNVAAGVKNNDAVNVSQLKANGFNVAVAHTGTGTSSDSTPSGATGAADKKIVGDETLTFEAGNGINVSQNGGKVTITSIGSGAGGGGNTHYYSVQSTQTGTGSNYNNDGATGSNSMALGAFAKANSANDVAMGHQAGALSGSGPAGGANGERVMIGANATVGSNQAISVNAGGSLGTVNLAVKSVGQSVAIGGGTGAQPESRTYAYGDQSLAFGSDTLAYGDSSVAIGGDDLDSAGSQQISYTDPTNGNQANGTVRQVYQALTGDTMQNGVYIKTASKQAGVSVGVQAQSGDLGVALGTKSTASGTASTAIGTGASANKDNAIALGAGSKTDINATQVTSATVGGLTYGNFAGNSSVAVGDQVSVGNTGFERQIKHVAPGEISAASTDAINGSQLYATQKTLGNVGNTVKTILGGNAAIDADGNITMSNIGGTGQNTIHDAIQAAKTKVQAADNSPVTVTGTGSSTDPYKVGVNTVTLAPATGTDAGKVAAPATGDAGKLVTAGDIANAINSSGFKATAGGNTTGATPTQELIKAGDTLTLKAGDGLTVEQSGSTFTYALNAQQITQNAQTPVVYTKADGSKVYKHTDGNFYNQPNGAGTQVATGDVIASMNAGDNTTSTPTTLANVKGNLADAATATANPANNSRSDFAGKGNNAATVNDVLNAGFNVQGNGVAKDFVTHGDTINFVNGQGTVANVTSTNGVTEVKFDTPLSYVDNAGSNSSTPSNSVKLVGGDPSKGVKLGNVAEGVNDTDAVNVAQLNAAKTKVQAADNSLVTVTGTGSSTDPYKVGVNTVTLAPATGTDAGKVAAPATGDAGKLVTAGDIANAINSSGFKATAGGNTTGATPTQELIKAGDTLTLKAGDGLTVEQSGSTFTYALNAQQITQNAQTPVVYTKADGSKVYKQPDGTFNTKADGSGTAVQPADIIASMQGADGATTATPATKDADGIMTMAGGTTLNNVASAGDITNPDNAYRAVNAGDLNNSVQKLVNNGFKIDADNGTLDTVKLGETVKYAGDSNIITTVSNNQIGFKLANTVTVGDAATGGKPVKIDGTTGNVTGLTNITWDPANTPITSGRAATEDQLLAVANAANSAGAGFTIAGNSKAAGVTTADETIKAGETLSIKGTGTGAFTDYDSSNIQTQVGANGEVTVGLKRDLTVNSVTAGNTKVDNNGITINNPADPSKNVSLSGNGLNNGGNTITNVGDGVADTDAVNVRQLKAAQTNVNNLTNNVIGTDKPNITTYDVHGNVADNQNTVVEAINNMNTGGIKFFHVNDGTGTQNTAGTLSHPEDSSAKGNYGAAVGYQAKADGENSVAMGKGAQAMGTNTISIGTGNVVTGNNSGAIGDPTTITGSGTYSVGNNNGTISANNAGAFGNNNTLTGDNSRIIGNSSTVTTTDTFVMGNNSTSNVANSVVLGSNAAATSAATASSAGTTTYASSVINGTTYNYAGATPTGVVSVGDVGKERRVQNVAAGLISADSTDAINGSQLYATNSAINALQTGAAGIVQYSNGGTQPNGGAATNHVTLVGGNQNAPVTVHNVAAGVAPTDAVNVSQLQGVAGQIGKVADEADAGTAAAMAAAGLPQAYLPGKSMVAVSGSTYRGKQGYAVGFSAINDGGNWIVKGIATGNSKGKFGATIGAGYQW
ncbi:YadA-like family protein [Kingella sp. (in: b-proteobacteria)]|uniref:YadA-like family protein n=1 Tax=Kingella sp. (in: b-proteobacteria) TaxID=2020713 RepID=UPI0026DB43BB|nr:YadA-like family protein [Kingella sp. (in: b-proteobacteria)]